MSKRPTQKPINAPVSASLRPEEMRLAIKKLNRRISELKSFDISIITDSKNTSVLALQSSIDATLEEIFGTFTTQYIRYKQASILDMTNYFLQLNRSHGMTPQEIQEGVQSGIERSIALLEQASSYLSENLDDLGQTEVGRALRAYEGLDLHPEIERAAGALYRDGHYASAIEDAVKALNGLVRLRSGESTDGTVLMESVFSPKKPILKFNDLSDDSATNEQKGFMMMFSGAVAGLRNPRAHKLIKDDPEQSLEFIAFVSLLAKLLDKSSK